MSNEEAVDVVMQSCSRAKKKVVRPSTPEAKLKMTRGNIPARENERSPPSKCRRVSTVKQTKIKNENRVFIEKLDYEGLLAACKKLADLAVDRGSLDDITVMIIDLHTLTQPLSSVT